VGLELPEGAILAVLGANGAGKTTLLRALAGVLVPARGTVVFRGRSIAGLPPERIVRAGISHVPEGRELFPLLSVRENLLMGAWIRRDAAGIERDLARLCSEFPVLGERA
ncbi:MAG: ABC transporter ATP-binding protein, partial [Rhodocyclales bacterium CG17_big_fil_post_rev_8_21_14_2_50_68_7]